MKSILTKKAKLDIKEASEWYEEKQKGLGFRFLKTIREEIKTISGNPKIFAIRYRETHTCVVSTFPYMIHYTIDSINNNIIIIGVLHTSLNPKKWK